LVLTPDVPSVKNTRRTLSILGRLSYPDDRITLVLNRWDKKSGLDAPVIADTVGRKIDALVTNDFPDTIDAINRGVLLQEAAPGAKVTRDLADLVQKLAGRAEAPRRSGFGARIKSWLGGREVHG
jgi:pilus assembly protein CpaE